MSKIETLICDKCGKGLTAINTAICPHFFILPVDIEEKKVYNRITKHSEVFYEIFTLGIYISRVGRVVPTALRVW